MPLSPEARKPSGPADWMRGHAAGLAAAVLGLAAVAVASLLYFGDDDQVTRIPDVRVTTPFLIATIVAALVSVVRREGMWALPIAGISLSAAAMVLGWAIVVGIIAVVTAAIILVMQELM
jgi:hypothetical protein